MNIAENKKGILLYDYLFARGGAEKLSFSIVRGFTGTDFCVALKDEKLFPSETSGERSGSIYALTKYTGRRGWKTLKTLLTFVFSKVFRKDYDWAIYSGEYAPMAILRNRKKAKKNILYCHTIPRAPYDLNEFKRSQMGPLTGIAFHFLCQLIKALYEPSIKRMDIVVANSENVRGRIKKYIGLESHVINPPVDVDRFKWLGVGDYYLSTARLEPAKRVDLIIRAFMEMPDKNLIVASGGSQYEKLVEMADGFDNIKFLGWTSDEELYDAVGNCIATIYIPMDEDFGMSPVESMSAGKPVIAVAEGGLLETVVDGETGVFIEAVNHKSVVKAVYEMTESRSLSFRDAAEKRAKLYSEQQFLSKLKAVIDGD
ncbi:glycosyltransferase [Microbulbifer sp. MCCC 1A16149]|uniref:glycosyltransferase n=1 Tax=Microbulbifer sp. MCCC 1A16149 TaxID=3411322 RepID=UPI003D0A1B94